MILERRTVPTVIELAGDGLHFGQPVTLTLHPAESGIRFCWQGRWVSAVPENVSDTTRCTRLGEISTVEHLMAALAGLEITDLDAELSSPELPALDGSARPYVTAIRATGELAPLAPKELPDLFSRIFVHEGEAKLAVAAGTGEWRYEFSCPGGWPEVQVYESHQVVEDFVECIAPARTFGFESEVPQIRAAGLAKGLDLEKALLIGKAGYANAARFPDEPARHKLLDAIGDLYLSGIPIRHLNVVAERTGHRMNIEAAKRLLGSLENH